MSHILLIDDDELFRKMLRATLVELGYAMTEARDGQEGLALHQLRPADLVIPGRRVSRRSTNCADCSPG
jgi:CheY-like chemotaxis protein